MQNLIIPGCVHLGDLELGALGCPADEVLDQVYLVKEALHTHAQFLLNLLNEEPTLYGLRCLTLLFQALAENELKEDHLQSHTL